MERETSPLLQPRHQMQQLTRTVARGSDGRYYSTVPRDERSPTPEPEQEPEKGKEKEAEKDRAPAELGKDPEETREQRTGKTWMRLLRLARPEYKMLGGAVGFLFVSSSITMAVPFAMGKIIDM
ncbi:hypothetical protein GGI11_008642, partial [Coemansia sp. RSA 2049]